MSLICESLNVDILFYSETPKYLAFFFHDCSADGRSYSGGNKSRGSLEIMTLGYTIDVACYYNVT